ncbi:YgaP family membrane protein [Methanosarcina sp.]|uniref:YgaP family membrane protein n=1 Tax=Methanosarcina sp. TaxID=2213 RepID=UPI003C77FB51
MEENVGGFDLLSRTIYGVLATLALATGLVKRSPWKWIVAAIAFTGLYSSILRHCTPYAILGISTAEKSKTPVQEIYFNDQ